MSKKTSKSLLVLASELIAITGTKDSEIVCVSVYGGKFGASLTINLDPFPLLRVCRQLAVPKSKIRIWKTEKYHHVSFEVRGARWICCIDDQEANQLLSKFGPPAIAEEAVAAPRLEQKPLLLTHATES